MKLVHLRGKRIVFELPCRLSIKCLSVFFGVGGKKAVVIVGKWKILLFSSLENFFGAYLHHLKVHPSTLLWCSSLQWDLGSAFWSLRSLLSVWEKKGQRGERRAERVTSISQTFFQDYSERGFRFSETQTQIYFGTSAFTYRYLMHILETVECVFWKWKQQMQWTLLLYSMSGNLVPPAQAALFQQQTTKNDYQ